MRGATISVKILILIERRLQSTPHMRGATFWAVLWEKTIPTSIHAPHAWGDGAVLDEYGQMRTSIHAPHAWGDLSLQTCSQGHPTSIHAPHAWGDQNGYICFGSFFDFNPRPICVGRPFVVYIITYTFKLQSTPHMRGATDSASRDFRTSRTSIHAPHAWGDFDRLDAAQAHATSIHAPHAWGDNDIRWRVHRSPDFNPRPTCVGRPTLLLRLMQPMRLQSTPHMRGATALARE